MRSPYKGSSMQFNQMNFTVEEEISEHPFDPHELTALQMGAGAGHDRAPRRGAPKLPDLWTRVVSLSHDDIQHLRCKPIQTDITIAETIDYDG
jgi:hypothetical protein